MKSIEQMIDSKVINIYARPWVKLEPKLKLRKINEFFTNNDEYAEEEEDDELLNWSNNLDFDTYLEEWKQLGTSGPSNPTEYEKSVLESVHQRLHGGNNNSSSSLTTTKRLFINTLTPFFCKP